ncbi:hypothetical protein PUN28_005694 [Cardiocondyla obscurior]|uniref:Uncharacterized protein n=1 Tax=Cardiocondyla obscurior TaxID=286306 RepID=A0AAW2GB80_9HYME
MTSFQQYCLRWTNHRSNLLTVFEDLLHNGAFTDVTLAVDHSLTIKCHKIVLAACSTYFQNLFHELPSQQHPIIVLKDVKYAEIKAILEYMYRGEVNVAQNQLPDLLKIAQVLKVKGLVEEHGNQRQTQSESAHDLRREDAINASTSSPPPAISTSTDGNCASHSSPPHSTGVYSSLHGKSGVSLDHIQSHHLASSWSMPLLSGASHQFPTSLSPSVLGGGSYDNGVEATASLKRRKMIHSSLLMNNDTPILRTVLGQAHVDSSQSQPMPLLQPDSHEPVHYRNLSSNGSANDADNRRSSDLASGDTIHGDLAYMDENERQSSPQSYASNIVRNSAATDCVQPKPEWKRYKQYTRNDIDQAIAAVKHGMSAVQAARKYGVPSRTLYDKVKKLGIPTSRPFKRSASNGGSGAGFPFGIGANVNGALYDNSGSGIIKSENTQPENEKADESGGGNTSVVEGLTGTSTAAFDTTYAKATKDTDYDSMSDSMTHCNTSPVISCAKQRQEQEQQEQQPDMDDQVEDLSVSRKPYVSSLRRVIVRPPSTPSSVAIKDETIKEDAGLDNNDCYS